MYGTKRKSTLYVAWACSCYLGFLSLDMRCTAALIPRFFVSGLIPRFFVFGQERKKANAIDDDGAWLL